MHMNQSSYHLDRHSPNMRIGVARQKRNRA